MEALLVGEAGWHVRDERVAATRRVVEAARAAGACSVDEVRLVFLMGIVEEMSGAPAKRDELFKAARRLTPADEATLAEAKSLFPSLITAEVNESIAWTDFKALIDSVIANEVVLRGLTNDFSLYSRVH
jgi:hypothetical protein